MEHKKLPLAPVAIVSGISALAQLPIIVDARAGRNGLLVLELLLMPGCPVLVNQLDVIAEYCQVETSSLLLSQAEDDQGNSLLVVEAFSTQFDFDVLFEKPREPAGASEVVDEIRARLPGVNPPDSEESWEAHEAIARA